MESKNTAATRRFLIAIGIMLAMAAAIFSCAISPVAHADEGDLVIGLGYR